MSLEFGFPQHECMNWSYWFGKEYTPAFQAETQHSFRWVTNEWRDLQYRNLT